MATILGKINSFLSRFKAHAHHTEGIGIPSDNEGAAHDWFPPGVAVEGLERAIDMK